MVVQFDVCQGFFPCDAVKQQIYNDAHETIEAADADLQPKMQELFRELRRINREFWKLASEQDLRDIEKWQEQAERVS